MEVARRLDAGEAGAGYREACLLVSATLSGIASIVWPGTGRDRARFVEAWVRYADSALSPARVSGPHLFRGLCLQRRFDEAEVMARARPQVYGPGQDCRVVTAEDADFDESDIATLLPDLSRKELRAYTYPQLFYTEVRSAIVHEYGLGAGATSRPMTRYPASVSYSNRLLPETGETYRMIHFQLEWLAAVVCSVAESVEVERDAGSIRPPATWWIHG